MPDWLAATPNGAEVRTPDGGLLRTDEGAERCDCCDGEGPGGPGPGPGGECTEFVEVTFNGVDAGACVTRCESDGLSFFKITAITLDGTWQLPLNSISGSSFAEYCLEDQIVGQAQEYITDGITSCAIPTLFVDIPARISVVVDCDINPAEIKQVMVDWIQLSNHPLRRRCNPVIGAPTGQKFVFLNTLGFGVTQYFFGSVIPTLLTSCFFFNLGSDSGSAVVVTA